MKLFNLFLFIILSVLSVSAFSFNDDSPCCLNESSANENTAASMNSDSLEVKEADVTVKSVEVKQTAKVCIVSGEEINEGEGSSFKYLGKTYEFCCKNCEKKFKAEPLNYIKEEINCPVMGEPASKEVFVVVDGTKYYMCCESCNAKFEKNPEKYLRQLEETE